MSLRAQTGSTAATHATDRSDGRELHGTPAPADGSTNNSPTLLAGLLTPEEVSKILRIPVGTLAQWRYRRIGPPYLKIGHHVRYQGDALDAWINGHAA